MPRIRDASSSSGSSVRSHAMGSSESLVSSSRDLHRFPSELDLRSVYSADFQAPAVVTARPKGVRPLPPIPTTVPPCYTEFCPHDRPTRRPIRPLPSPPVVIDVSPSPTQHQNVAATPVSPQPVLSVIPAAEASPTPSVRLVTRRNGPTLPFLVTDAALLTPPPPSDPVSGSDSPATPQPLTPQAAKQKRITKLRRHLGELIPDEAVPVIHAAPQHRTAASLERMQKAGVDSIYLRAAITVSKILNIGDDGASDGSSVASEEDESWDFVDNGEYQPMTRRESRRWVREKGGRRWEESNYENVLQALRAL